jgi:hypothetical protein
MAKYLVVGMQSYDFKDDNGRQMKGSNIFFLDESSDDTFKGFKTGKMPIPEGFIKTFTTFPGFYDLDFSVKVGAQGKVNAKLESIQFIAPAIINEQKTATR